MLRSS
jgi:long-chain fatty acid transport protein